MSRLIRHQTMKRIFGFTAISTLVALGGCAEERPAIDRVQPDYLDKQFFVGEKLQDSSDDPEFYHQGTLVDVNFGATQDGLFTNTYAQPLSRIKFQVTENYLIARITYERIADSDGKGAGPTTNDGVIAAMYRIDKHFDIVKAYNSTTGEELNIVEENASDRPWYERRYMRVDWSANLATDTYDFDTLSMMGVYGGVKYEPMAYYINDPKDPDAPRFAFEDGYFDITTKAFAKPQEIDLSGFDWGIDSFPACFLDNDFLGGSAPSGNCNPAELTIRQAFLKVPKTDYEPAHWDGEKFQAIGPFTTDRNGYSRNYGMSDAKWHRFISRYEIWERSHFYNDPANMTGAVECFTPETTPYGSDPHRDENADGTEDECAAVGRGSRCDEFSQKCTLPYRDRVAKPIAWYFSEGNDSTYWEPSYEATHNWDVAMRSAVMTAKYAECKRMGEADCSAFPVYNGQQDENDDAMNLAREVDDCKNGRAYADKGRNKDACNALADSIGDARGYSAGVKALAKMDEMVVLCHSPVLADDPAACGTKRLPAGLGIDACLAPTDEDTIAACEGATRARRGDIRYHQVTIIREPQNESPWGIMVDADDPLTGRKVAASINVWSQPTDRWSQSIVDTARYIGGELLDSEITDGQNVKDWAQASEAASQGGALSKMDRDEFQKRMADTFGKDPSEFQNMSLPDGGRGVEISKAIKAQMRNVAAKVGAPSSNRATYAARRQAAAGTEIEAALMTPMMQEYSGVSNMPLTQSVLDIASPLRGANPSIQRDFRNMKEVALAQRGACIMNEAPAPLAISDLANLLQKKFGNFDPTQSKAEQHVRAEKMRLFLAQRAHMGVIAHEMGHSIGLRHNFVSSADAWGYRPQYWQLRTKNGAVTQACNDLSSDGENCVGPRYFDPVTPEEKSNYIWAFMQSTVMDYPGEGTQELHGLAAYDFAAARFFYGDVISVFADPSYNVGGARAQGLLTKMDNFGGILGFSPQIGADEIHYSQLQKSFDLVKDCKVVDPAQFRPAAWRDDAYGTWDPTFDGLIVQVNGQYTSCKTQPVDYVNWVQLRKPNGTEAGNFYNGGPAIEKNANRLRVPYGFGTDNWADLGNLSVYRNDNGADAYELFNFLITQQEVGHIFDNYRRGRQDFSVRSAANRSFSRYNEKLRDAAKGLGLLKNIYELVSESEGYNFDDFWPAYGPQFFKENVLTAGMAFDHFAHLLARPQDGAHYRVVGGACTTNADCQTGLICNTGPKRCEDPVLRSADDTWGTPTTTRVIVPNGATGFFQQVGFGGRPLQNALAEDQGEYNSEYTINAGSYYDKSWTAMLMTESVDNFISSSRSDFFDARYRSVSIADLFPDGYRRWLANNLTNDDAIKGPRVVAQTNGNPDVDASRYPKTPIGWTNWWAKNGPEVCFPNSNSLLCSSYGSTTDAPFNAQAPANVAILDPQIGWEQQKFLIAWTAIYLPENQQQWWIDQLRLWELGVDNDPGITQRIEFHNPNGKTYVARTIGTEVIFGKTVQKGIAARILEYANELSSKAYKGQWVTGPDGVTKWWEADINPTTGQPIVMYDKDVLAFDANGGDLATGKPGCNATDSSQCTCTANKACMQLRQYVEVPFFLRQTTATMGMLYPGWKGVY